MSDPAEDPDPACLSLLLPLGAVVKAADMLGSYNSKVVGL